MVCWDNWGGRDIPTERPALPPRNREASLFARCAEYWLNVNPPVRGSIALIASLAFLQTHQRSPLPELPALFLSIARAQSEWTQAWSQHPQTVAEAQVELSERFQRMGAVTFVEDFTSGR